MTTLSRSSDNKSDDEIYLEQMQKTIQTQNDSPVTLRPNYIAPSTPTQEKIAQIWMEVLGHPQISIDDDLFRMGGDSIMALQILGRIYQLFQVELRMDVIFAASFTVGQLSELVDEQVIMHADKDELAAILKELDGLSDDEVKALLAKP